jgi:putative tryptophan/tyrosine transport system substrate-binding protein
MRPSHLRRREFVTLLGSAAVAWPLAARAQQPTMPVIGWLESGSKQLSPYASAGFRQGLNEMGYVEGRNVAIEYRWADGQNDRLPELAAELVRRRVAVIFATDTTNSAQAARAATVMIPIVFTTGGDPVKLGLVASLPRPGGNVTGVTTYVGALVAKRLELLRELVPQATIMGFLTNPTNLSSDPNTTDIQAAAGSVGQQMIVLRASTVDEIDAAFATAARERAGALLVDGDGLLFSRRAEQLAALAARYGIPANYPTRLFPEVGGLMSYGDDRLESWHQTGIYVGRILKGEKPADLPVLQPTKFEFVINLKTAKALGITFPPSFHLRADEVID